MKLLMLFLITFALLALALVFLGIKMLVKKNGSFPQNRIGHNKVMRANKIYCPRTLDKLERMSKKIKV
ncbi:MAG: hypothetical protein K9H16_06140 [Bacteroidales bacterium]|nr:hypothetical protein [Bacteroidales bacterium]